MKPRQRVRTLGATMGPHVQAMDGKIVLRQRTKQPNTMMRSWADTKRPQRRQSGRVISRSSGCTNVGAGGATLRGKQSRFWARRWDHASMPGKAEQVSVRGPSNQKRQ